MKTQEISVPNSIVGEFALFLRRQRRFSSERQTRSVFQPYTARRVYLVLKSIDDSRIRAGCLLVTVFVERGGENGTKENRPAKRNLLENAARRFRCSAPAAC